MSTPPATLDTDIRYLKGIGEKRAKLLKKLGVETFFDLLRLFPRDYEDRTVTRSIGETQNGESVCVRAMVASRPRLSRISGGRDMVRAAAVDDTGRVELTFFNQPYVKDALEPGVFYIFFGKVERDARAVRMISPKFERDGGALKLTGRLAPLYPLTAGLRQKHVSGAVRACLDAVGLNIPEQTPEYICKHFNLCGLNSAYEYIHFPKDENTLSIARRRLMFDELYSAAIISQARRKMRAELRGAVFHNADLTGFFSALPFTPTTAQLRAVDDAKRDLSSGRVMNRIIQGDVGSGKTLVAAAACAMCAQSGYQAAFMAPTELLCRQHYDTLSALLTPLGIRVGLLIGALTQKARRAALASIARGEFDVIVGTHTLFSDDTRYAALALVITDEQHRFGVNQRSAFVSKGTQPHVLVMSATPIPRTLALALYGDLDISSLDELPRGRKPVKTFAVSEKHRDRLYRFARKLITEGRQAYFVCPAIDDTEREAELTSAYELHKTLSQTVFPDLSVGLVHGGQKPAERDAAMFAFASGQMDILVATTVIEVGLDVPNAALMVIENADRFGLSQLHQLRGRVGRGAHESFCVMFEGAGGSSSRERLETLCRTNSGFEIAEADLRQRGPGDFFGSRQHGLAQSSLAGLITDPGIVDDARTAADITLRRDPELAAPESRLLKSRIDRLFSEKEKTIN
jgi:ATP-dependent DNA helicase RecG